tara:strand:- start:47 stop:304 length:258 start_codon:yes stop_codon:yes gene_type:complete
MEYKITLTETEKLAMETITDDVFDWISNAAINRARIAKEEIISELIAHCNANEIALAVGETKQVQQAYDLKIVSKLEETSSSLPE